MINYKPRDGSVRKHVMDWVNNKKFRPFTVDELISALLKSNGSYKYTPTQLRKAFYDLKNTQKLIYLKEMVDNVSYYSSKIEPKKIAIKPATKINPPKIEINVFFKELVDKSKVQEKIDITLKQLEYLQGLIA